MTVSAARAPDSSLRRNAIARVSAVKSAEKNCSEAGSYYSVPACRAEIIRIGIHKPKGGLHET